MQRLAFPTRMRTWRKASEKGRAAMQKQIFVGWKGTRRFNLVAEPRWFLALATLLTAVVAECWIGVEGGTSTDDSFEQNSGRQQDAKHVSLEVEHQTTFTTILAKSTTMTERVVTAATTIDCSNSDGRSDKFALQQTTFAADLTTTTANPRVPLKPFGVLSDLNADDQVLTGWKLCLCLNSIQR